MKQCIFGGQYGSEGKGAVSEWYAKQRTSDMLVVAGENAPNSGHTCSMGKTRNLPAASFFADVIILGPDSVIDPQILREDMSKIAAYRGKPVDVLIHSNAALMMESDKGSEIGIVNRISSTGSGSGLARSGKYIDRWNWRTIGWPDNQHGLMQVWDGFPVRVLNRVQYLHQCRLLADKDWLFECSQGVLLDTNWGVYPYVTSRSTLPACALSRNGLDFMDWQMVGVYRTFPIRTGGPSGPTGGEEIKFSDLGVQDEIATVTKRIRRIFKFSRDDFYISMQVAKPDVLAFTHIDYLNMPPSDSDMKSFIRSWIDAVGVMELLEKRHSIIASMSAGQFAEINKGAYL